MKAAEVKKMSDQELVEAEEGLRKRGYELRVQSVTEKLANPHELGNIKRDVARLLTERRARKNTKG